MRHKKSGRKLNRSSSHRSALFRNMAKSLLTYGKIRTTEAKARELRGVVEPLITLALRNDLHARRQAYKVLGSHQLVKQLFDEIGPRFVGVPGGYTRVLKLGAPRPGDNAPMAVIELTRLEEQVAEAAPTEDAPAEKAPAKKAAARKAKASAPEEPADKKADEQVEKDEVAEAEKKQPVAE